jgi:PIF1-like helicase
LNFNPSVISLEIHLQGERVFIIRNSTLPEDHETSSQLERYLSRPMEYQDMTYITYYEETNIYSVLPVTYHQYQMDTGIPPRYVVNRGPENKRVARILWTPPSSTELFSLRRILLHEPVLSFDEARTYNGTVHETYREAGVAKGLFVEGGEFRLSLQEAVTTYATPQELRIMLITCYQAGANPTALLSEFQTSMSADIQGNTAEDVQQELLSRLHEISDHHGGRLLRSFQTFPPPPELLPATEMLRAEAELNAAATPDALSAAILDCNRLNIGQRLAFDTIVETVQQRKEAGDIRLTDGRLFFLQGAAGTGKTFLINTLRKRLHSQNILTSITATTGIAAALYEGGRTLHSLLGLGAQDNNELDKGAAWSSRYGPRSERAELLRSLHVIVIDEASMIDRAMFEAVDAILNDLRSPPGPSFMNPGLPHPKFAGLNIVLAGDYRQLLPVVRTSFMPPSACVTNPGVLRIQSHILRHLPWDSELWNGVEVLYLTQSVRQAEDVSFSDLLLTIGNGTYNEHTPLPFRATLQPHVAYNWLWRWMQTKNKLHVDVDRMLLASVNSKVDEHLEEALKLFPGHLITLTAITELDQVRSNPAVDNNGANPEAVLPEMAIHMAPTGVPLHKLRLKIGAPVMIIRNVCHPQLVNGRVLIVKRFTTRCIFLGLPGTHHAFIVHRIDFLFYCNGMRVRRRQFPVRLSFASTVHKSQGRTLSRVVLDLRSSFFTPGQLYVALSRTRRAEDILILYQNENENDDDNPGDPIHDMPLASRNPILPECVQFSIPPH